jgi:hypothetical protein
MRKKEEEIFFGHDVAEYRELNFFVDDCPKKRK